VIQVSVLHGNLLPQERDKVMDDFRAGRTKVSDGCTQWTCVVFLRTVL
jgi:hypothetical protein